VLLSKSEKRKNEESKRKMASLVNKSGARFKSVKHQRVNNSEKGKSISIAADKLAKIIVGIATSGFGLDFQGLLGSLKAGISNEDQDQSYEETKVFKKELKLAVIHLHKTLKKSRGTFAVVSGVTYEIRMEGEITVIEADNSEALDKLYEVVNQDAKLALKQLLHTDTEDTSMNNTQAPPPPQSPSVRKVEENLEMLHKKNKEDLDEEIKKREALEKTLEKIKQQKTVDHEKELEKNQEILLLQKQLEKLSQNASTENQNVSTKNATSTLGQPDWGVIKTAFGEYGVAKLKQSDDFDGEIVLNCKSLDLNACDNLSKALSLLPEAEKLTICPDGLFAENYRIPGCSTDGFKLLFSGLGFMTSLREISFNQCVFDEECCKALALEVLKMKGLRHFGASKCNITEKGCQHFLPISQMKKIKVVDLGKNNINNEMQKTMWDGKRDGNVEVWF
jgi:hypothetical protein